MIVALALFAPVETNAQTTYNFKGPINGYYNTLDDCGLYVYPNDDITLWGSYLSDYGFVGYAKIEFYDAVGDYLGYIWITLKLNQTYGTAKSFYLTGKITGAGDFTQAEYAHISLSKTK